MIKNIRWIEREVVVKHPFIENCGGVEKRTVLQMLVDRGFPLEPEWVDVPTVKED